MGLTHGLDTTWYKGQWWAFFKMNFGIDDNKWFGEYGKSADTSTGWDSQQLYEVMCNR